MKATLLARNAEVSALRSAVTNTKKAMLQKNSIQVADEVSGIVCEKFSLDLDGMLEFIKFIILEVQHI